MDDTNKTERDRNLDRTEHDTSGAEEDAIGSGKGTGGEPCHEGRSGDRRRVSRDDAFLDQFEQLTMELSAALLEADTERIRHLVAESSTCIRKISECAWRDEDFCDRARARLAALEPLRDRNDQLLEQLSMKVAEWQR
ncbi:hypothetical protein JI721_11245 [Alicyclobacillus cycloheptanicus]|uniref:Coat F domain-containing protein n=1 Tax=Alicyclobacillus cycloheptanicus TaxID=1457 RepID=A0ABT9XK34_9BACL|nr:hypothetical protein [Alicyclobacillus cycloheptanicus]MDQ0190672.1 hypothetical protein [Alicyclobacillus cycloheptanicus]WDM00310.1 hypothetical protein JI721_11245 [Alicyclobacillus cycloheptanicus]